MVRAWLARRRFRVLKKNPDYFNRIYPMFSKAATPEVPYVNAIVDRKRQELGPYVHADSQT